MVAHGLRILNYCLPDGRKQGGREGEMEKEEEGASKQHIYICISTLDLAGKTNCLHKHSRGVASITYFSAAQTLENDSPIFS